jgi:hypothetical protein
MKNNEIGIGIVDIYDDNGLISCVKSLKDITNDVSTYVISNRILPTKDFAYDKKITHQVSMATLRNHCLAHFRCLGLKYIFLINSNVIITDPNFIEKTIKTAEAFGTWLMTGYNENSTHLDDSESNQSLSVNTVLNTDFLFIRSGIIGNLGYFDERYVNTKDLDVLDYINKARKIDIYPPHPFHPTIGNYIKYTDSKIQKIEHSDSLDKNNPSVGFSYGYFLHQHKYIPDQDYGIKSISKDELMVFMGDLQKNYATYGK